jgi:hypothetical protein
MRSSTRRAIAVAASSQPASSPPHRARGTAAAASRLRGRGRCRCREPRRAEGDGEKASSWRRGMVFSPMAKVGRTFTALAVINRRRFGQRTTLRPRLIRSTGYRRCLILPIGARWPDHLKIAAKLSPKPLKIGASDAVVPAIEAFRPGPAARAKDASAVERRPSSGASPDCLATARQKPNASAATMPAAHQDVGAITRRTGEGWMRVPNTSSQKDVLTPKLPRPSR